MSKLSKAFKRATGISLTDATNVALGVALPGVGTALAAGNAAINGKSPVSGALLGLGGGVLGGATGLTSALGLGGAGSGFTGTLGSILPGGPAGSSEAGGGGLLSSLGKLFGIGGSPAGGDQGGGILNALGNLFGGGSQAGGNNILANLASGYLDRQGSKDLASAIENAARTGAEASQQGFNYLKNNTLLPTVSDIGGKSSQIAYDALNNPDAFFGNYGVGRYGTPGDQAALDRALAFRGVTDPTKSSNALQNYLDSTDYNFRLSEGNRALTSNAAARGLLDSGQFAKDIVGYGQNLARGGINDFYGRTASALNDYQNRQTNAYQNYLQGFQNLSQQGIAAAGALGGAASSAGANAAQLLANAGADAAQLRAQGSGAFNQQLLRSLFNYTG